MANSSKLPKIVAFLLAIFYRPRLSASLPHEKQTLGSGNVQQVFRPASAAIDKMHGNLRFFEMMLLFIF